MGYLHAKYTYSGAQERNKDKTDSFNCEGVIKRNNKWIVRLKNPTSTKKMKPFISHSQHSDKSTALKIYNELKNVT